MSHQAPNLTLSNFTHEDQCHDNLPNDEQLLSCELCLKSIPLSESEISEAKDYIAYFCGLECYDVWRHQKST